MSIDVAFRRNLFMLSLPISCLLAASSAGAKTTLPPVVVTTPSPVATAPPKAAPRAPAQQAPIPQQHFAPPAQAAQAAPAADVAPDDRAVDAEPPPGVLIVAEQAFVPVTVVPGREVLSTSGANVADALQFKPGITSSSFAPGASRPIIRGFDNTRVRVQENGIGSHDVSSLSEDHAVPIDPNAASRIEVVRGPATLRYGSQAIGGVENVTNQRIPEYIPRGGVSAVIQGGVSSVDRGRDGAFQATAGAGNFVVHADGFERDAADYRTPHGRQLNSFVNANGHALGGSFVGRDGYAGLSYSRYSSLYGIPGGEAATKRTRIDLGVSSSSRAASGVQPRSASRRSATGRVSPATATTRSPSTPTPASTRPARASPIARARPGSRCSTCRSRRPSASCAARSACRSVGARRRARVSKGTACSIWRGRGQPPCSCSRSCR